MPAVSEQPSALQVAIRKVIAHPHIRARLLALALVRTPFRATADELVRGALERLFDGRAPWDPAGTTDLVEHLGTVLNALAWEATHDGAADDWCDRLVEELRRRLRARKDELALRLVDLVERGVETHADQAQASGSAIDDVALAHRRIGRHVRAMIRGDREMEDQAEVAR
jgi:hypothetical protein